MGWTRQEGRRRRREAKGTARQTPACLLSACRRASPSPGHRVPWRGGYRTAARAGLRVLLGEAWPTQGRAGHLSRHRVDGCPAAQSPVALEEEETEGPAHQRLCCPAQSVWTGCSRLPGCTLGGGSTRASAFLPGAPQKDRTVRTAQQEEG